jgi:hypothetical protein
MAVLWKGRFPLDCLKVAEQRPIVRSEPVIPRETAEFDSDGLADARQWATDPLPPDTTVGSREANTPRRTRQAAWTEVQDRGTARLHIDC